MHRILPWFAIIVLTACGQTSGPPITAEDSWIREPAPGRNVAAGYVTIANHTEDDRRLIAAWSDNASAMEIHTMTRTDGMMRMRKVDAVDLPAGSTVRLEPGGLHLMLRELSPVEAGNVIPVTLEFDDGSKLELAFSIRAANSGGGHGH